MKRTSFAKVAKIAQLNPKNVVGIQDYLELVMKHFDHLPSKWASLSDEYILHLCEQYKDEVF